MHQFPLWSVCIYKYIYTHAIHNYTMRLSILIYSPELINLYGLFFQEKTVEFITLELKKA